MEEVVEATVEELEDDKSYIPEEWITEVVAGGRVIIVEDDDGKELCALVSMEDYRLLEAFDDEVERQLSPEEIEALAKRTVQ